MAGRILDRLTLITSTGAMWIAAALLVYMVLHINAEIVLRVFFDSSTFSMDEYVGYAIGAMTFLALAHTFRERKHVRVTLLQKGISDRLAIFVELVCIAFAFAAGLFLARFIWRTLARDFSRGSVSPTLTETPIWIIDAAIFIGVVLFLAQLLASAFLTIRDGVAPSEDSGD